jgi:hypothetical protein
LHSSIVGDCDRTLIELVDRISDNMRCKEVILRER